jgi:hypothetical protein
MGRKATLKEAAKILGPPFTETELRRGALIGKYPYMRAGGPRGKIIFDIELLEKRISDLMLENINTQDEAINFLRR